MRYDRVILPLAAALAGLVLGAAVAAGTTLLIYAGQGILATSGFLVSLALAATAAAFWVGTPPSPAGPPASRGRWVAAILAFGIAAVFGGYWADTATAPRSALLNALAVLLLLATPAYTVAAVLAALHGRGRGTAAPALAGAALGVIAAAGWLIPRVDPGILFLDGAIVLLVAGWVESRAAPAARRESRGMDGKVVIVTGVGARGQVGYALAEAFLARGARVVITDVRPDVEALAGELGGEARAAQAERKTPGAPDAAGPAAGREVSGIAANLTRAEEAERVVAFTRERFGRLDVLVNAAGGLTVIRPLGETTPEEWARELDINARTAFLMSRAALPLLREARGTIINFASPAGLRAVPQLGAYSAAKAGVVALTRALAIEEREHGVRVNAIAPGMIDTEQNRRAVPDPDAVKWVTREQIAEVVLFLASDAGSGVNGEVVGVPGEGVE